MAGQNDGAAPLLGAVLGRASHYLQAEPNDNPNVHHIGNAQLFARWAKAGGAATLRVTWTYAGGGGNLQFAAVAVAGRADPTPHAFRVRADLGTKPSCKTWRTHERRRPACRLCPARARPQVTSADDAPCAAALCTEVATCAGNCSTVALDEVGDVDWLHAGPPVAAAPPPPAHAACTVPAALGELGHLQIAGPPAANATASWLGAMRRWRTACLAELRLSGDIYRVPQLEWGRTAYFQPLMMPFDRYFYDATLGNYTVGKYSHWW
jgi:hypothetical protein